MLTDSSSLVTRLTEECHRSDGERSLEWQTPVVAYPFGSLHDLCVAVVVILLDEVVRQFRQDLSILLIICHHSLPEEGSVFRFGSWVSMPVWQNIERGSENLPTFRAMTNPFGNGSIAYRPDIGSGSTSFCQLPVV